MDKAEFKLECLKLASQTSRDIQEIVARAKMFEEHCAGPQVKTGTSDNSSKSGQKPPNQKSDNSIFK